MSNDSKIYFNREEQVFLMEMFETDDPVVGAESFARCLIKEGVDVIDLKDYLRKVMKAWSKQNV